MAEVTYYVVLPFVASDDGVAAGEPTECFRDARRGAFAQGRPR
jgi:hypothetical protein